MAAAESILTISYVNIRGQTGLHLDKQLQLEEFIKRSNCDIIHLQEAHIEEDTFSQCNFIESNFSVLVNNAANKYGTASLVKNDLVVENVLCDTGGRVLAFNISGVTFANIYLPSGTDTTSRSNREKYAAEIIPEILVNRQSSGCAGGDFNCITKRIDATNNPDQKMSPCLGRLINVFDWSDSYRSLHPTSTTFSRYYEARGITGASRIDRQYHCPLPSRIFLYCSL
jgi:exonuclease III